MDSDALWLVTQRVGDFCAKSSESRLDVCVCWGALILFTTEVTHIVDYNLIAQFSEI